MHDPGREFEEEQRSSLRASLIQSLALYKRQNLKKVDRELTLETVCLFSGNEEYKDRTIREINEGGCFSYWMDLEKDDRILIVQMITESKKYLEPSELKVRKLSPEEESFIIDLFAFASLEESFRNYRKRASSNANFPALVVLEGSYSAYREKMLAGISETFTEDRATEVIFELIRRHPSGKGKSRARQVIALIKEAKAAKT